MSTSKVRFLLLVGLLTLICVAVILPGCARFGGIIDFTASPTSGKRPLSVQFTPAVEGSARRWIWNFGDGQTSTERSPQHTYTDAGAHTVILTVIPRRGEPASVMKIDYIAVQSGFGGSPASLTVEDDDFELPQGEALYVLDVLENDAPGDGAAGLTITGVSAYGYDYDDFECETYAGFAMINHDGTAIEYEPFNESSDTFYYLATDGQTTAEGEVWIDYSTEMTHLTVRDDRFVIGGWDVEDSVPRVWNPLEGTCYELDVLSNDVPGSGAPGLKVIGVSGYKDGYYSDRFPTEQGYAYISPDGTAVHYQVFDYDQPFDTVYYRVTDGWGTAEGEAALTFDLHWYDD